VRLEEALQNVRTLDREAMALTRKRLDSIIKPLGSLGMLEEHLVRIAGITAASRFDFSHKAVVVFCADNGVVDQGITQSGREVTAIVTENLATGDTCLCAMARVAGAQVLPVDIGVAAELTAPGILRRRVAAGTRDFSREPALRAGEVAQAIEVGIDLAGELRSLGFALVGMGEMGIGNTASSAAVAAALLDLPPEAATGRGAGLSAEGLARKIEVIRRALELHRPRRDDPLDVLAKVGGLDIAGMAGLCIGGAVYGVPVVLDGFISNVAALAACRLCPGARDFLLPSHLSAEPASTAVLAELGLRPPLQAGMRLGEGTGAVATFPLYDMILAVYNEMVTFAEEDMEAYRPL